MALVSFNEVFKQFWKGEGLFERKSIPFSVSSAGNRGASDKAHFTWLTKPELKKHYEVLYQEYSRLHPFTPSAKALTNPGLMQMEKNIWAKKCQQYCLTNERQVFSEMLYKGAYGQKADVKPRQGATLSSSWIKGLRINNANTVSINLGGKYYTYNCPKSAQQRLMQLQSIGHEISQARKGASSILHRIPGYK